MREREDRKIEWASAYMYASLYILLKNHYKEFEWILLLNTHTHTYNNMLLYTCCIHCHDPSYYVSYDPFQWQQSIHRIEEQRIKSVIEREREIKRNQA